MGYDPIIGGDGAPPEPDWSALFDDDLDRVSAAEHWSATIRELRAEATLTIANGHAIRRLVEFRVQYQRAARHVAEHGAILKASKAKIGQFNPYWAVMKHASDEIRLLEAELGIAPVRRSRATKVKREKKSERASDRYLNPVS
jgi:P27 family predicted phage terminase small subunit